MDFLVGAHRANGQSSGGSHVVADENGLDPTVTEQLGRRRRQHMSGASRRGKTKSVFISSGGADSPQSKTQSETSTGGNDRLRERNGGPPPPAMAIPSSPGWDSNGSGFV